MFNNISRLKKNAEKQVLHFAVCPYRNSGYSSCTSETLNAASMQSHAEVLETHFFVFDSFH